jgi:predicted nucleotidyltransferase component of viral defense system
MTTKAKGESVRQKLTTAAKKLNAKFRDVETIFLIERLVARLVADKKLTDKLVFKGGFVGLKVYESGPQTVKVSPLIGHEPMSWSVYPIETICAEKLHALISHGDQNSRSKDVHDLAVFLPKTDPKTLRKAIKNCFEFRETEVPQSFLKEIKNLNTSRLQKGWSSAVASISSAITFEEAFTKLIDELKNIENRW